MASHCTPPPRLLRGLGAGVIGLIAVACSTGAYVQPCGEIASGGCPAGRGGTCDDAECVALYDCVDGAWQLVASCPAAGGGGSASYGGGGAGGTGAGGCAPAVIDHTGEVSGCQPGLQEPDCPVAAAESCAPCLTGCSDFFLCAADGWRLMAYCYGGEIVLAR